MFVDIITLLFSVIILLFPLLFWMYIFTSFDHLWVSRLQFIIGIIAWVFTTLPLVFENTFILWGLIEEIFFTLSFISSSFLGIGIFIQLILFFTIIFCSLFFVNYIFFQKNIFKFHSSIWGFVILLWVFSFLIFLLYIFWKNISPLTSIESGSFVFSGLWAIAGYYIVISLLEEGMKYFSSLNISWERQTLSFEKMLVCWAVIALGFSFFENILYAYGYILSNGIDGWLLHLVFFRTLFTISLHVLCSMLLAAWFYILIMLPAKYSKAYLLFFMFSCMSILSHAFFDIAITFWYIAVVFFYIFFLYLLVWYITSPGE